MKWLTRPEIMKTAPAQHGAFDFAELEQLGLTPDEVLDFSVNSNPYGPSPQARTAAAAVTLERYPDRESIALRRALADQLEVPPEHILIGNGGAELLWLISFAFLQRGDRVLVIGPTFGEYSRTAALMGARVHLWQANPVDNFAVHSQAIIGRLRQLQPRLVFLCNPNNPTGWLIPPAVLEEWVQANRHILFVVDEAYLTFAGAARSALKLKADNVLVVRSMTKDYALAGLRLGYAVSANPVLAATLKQTRPAWNVNAPAQAAGLAALVDTAYLAQCMAGLAQSTQTLRADLTALGWRPCPSATHYFVMNVGDAAGLRQKLLKKKILVRDCASFGLPEFVRIATRQPSENRQLVAALQALLSLNSLQNSAINGAPL